VGSEQVHLEPMPSIDAEDFSFMLQEKPEYHVWLGNGSSDGSCSLHNPHYDFNLSS
jgi:hippurate hydrolase